MVNVLIETPFQKPCLLNTFFSWQTWYLKLFVLMWHYLMKMSWIPEGWF